MISIEELNKLNSIQLSKKYMTAHNPEFVEFLKNLYCECGYDEAIYLYMHNMIERPICPVCKNELHFLNKHKGYTKYCCSACANKSEEKKNTIKKVVLEKYGVENVSQLESIKLKKKDTCEKHYLGGYSSKEIINKAKETCLEKYGDANYRNFEKCKQTCLEKYGVEYAISSKIVKEKIKTTNIERYNSNSPFGNKIVQEKSKRTCLDVYGVEHASQSNVIKDKIKNTCIGKYGVEYASQSTIVQEKIKTTCLKKYGVKNAFLIHGEDSKYKAQQTCLEKYGVPYYVLAEECLKSANNDSKPNLQFAKLLDSKKIQYEREFQLESFSYDFVIGNILIEINPFSTHNSTWGIFGNPKSKLYHKTKTDIANKNGYRCVHVWDWDNKNKIADLLKEKTGIYARKCNLHLVNKKELNAFLDNYHLQGTCKGQKIAIGLYYENELVQVMTFGKPRYNKNYEYELLRLCTKAGYAIIGGAQKLFKHFIDEYKPTSIISYCDNSKFIGTIYANLGFSLLSKGVPSKHWYNGKVHITDNMLRKLGYDKIFNANYGKGTSNEQLMLEHKFVEIYDCGQSVYIYKQGGMSSTIS